MSYANMLRRNDGRRQELATEHSRQKRAKAAHMKEILTSNFLRKFPMPKDTSTTDSIRIQTTVSKELDAFLTANTTVTTVALSKFYQDLAHKLELVRGAAPSTQASRVRSVEQNRGTVQLPAIGAKSRYSKLQKSSQDHFAAKRKTIDNTKSAAHITTENPYKGNETLEFRNSRDAFANQQTSHNTRNLVRQSLPVSLRTEKIEDVPSDISADEWGEIQRYGQTLAREATLKEQLERKTKQAQVRSVLDK